MILKISDEIKFGTIKAGLFLILFSFFPLFYVYDKEEKLAIDFILLSSPYVVITVIMSFLSKKAAYIYVLVALMFSFMAVSSLIAVYVALADLNIFILLFFIYLVFIVKDIYVVKRAGYFYHYQIEFNKNIFDDIYSLSDLKEFEILTKYRKGAVVPKIQYLYILLLPILMLMKAFIFKLSNEGSMLNNNGVDYLMAVCFAYITGIVVVGTQDLFTKAYFSYKYNGS